MVDPGAVALNLTGEAAVGRDIATLEITGGIALGYPDLVELTHFMEHLSGSTKEIAQALLEYDRRSAEFTPGGKGGEGSSDEWSGVIFGLGLGWLVLLAVFLLDLLVSRRAWCGHLCPMGAFYSLLALPSPLRVRADKRAQCDDCMDCFAVCPESQVIRPALKGDDKGIGPVITGINCTNCGRCIDVCARDVFRFGSRFRNRCDSSEPGRVPGGCRASADDSPGVEVLR